MNIVTKLMFLTNISKHNAYTILLKSFELYEHFKESLTNDQIILVN